jgi:hypothetical protein
VSDIKAYTCSLNTHTHKLTSTGVLEADRSAPPSPKGSKGSFLAVRNQRAIHFVTGKQKTKYLYQLQYEPLIFLILLSM